jgi:cobalamin biosynthesis protein CobT
MNNVSPKSHLTLISPIVIMSTLNSVVGDSHAPQWEAGRLNSNDILVQFYDKFWGISMDEEVNDWRESAQDEGMDSGDEHEEEEGNSEAEGDDADANEGEQANEEEGEDDEEDDEDDSDYDEDEIIDGCCVLDVNIPGLETSIWVRAEYIRIFEHIAKLYDSVVDIERKDQKSSCVILTGQPGIGELHF